ncbi:hypothetical protein PO909_027035 [Leuciscus waleckii]
MWCQAAETLTTQFTDLGQNVTINCELGLDEVTWLLLNLPDPPVVILRSFSNPPSTFYFNKIFKQKYSMQSNRLIINNITIDELGVYYCMNSDRPEKFSGGTRLHITAPTQLTELTECQNHTEVKDIQQNQTPWRTFTIISALLNAVLVIVVIGLLKVFAVGNNIPGGRLQELHTTDLQQTQEIQEVQPQESHQPQVSYM